MSIDRLLVVGAGQMGSGIAQVAAQTGLEVALADVSMDYAQKGVAVSYTHLAITSTFPTSRKSILSVIGPASC